MQYHPSLSMTHHVAMTPPMIACRYVRSWQCGRALRAILPGPRGVPVYGDDVPEDESPVDIFYEGEIAYVVTRGIDWHSDWEQVFSLVCVAGSGTLCVADRVTRYRPVKAYTSIPVRRGTVIQLWADAWHRLSIRGRSMTFIELNGSEDRMVFPPREEQETAFIDCITNDRQSPTVTA